MLCYYNRSSSTHFLRFSLCPTRPRVTILAPNHYILHDQCNPRQVRADSGIIQRSFTLLPERMHVPRRAIAIFFIIWTATWFLHSQWFHLRLCQMHWKSKQACPASKPHREGKSKWLPIIFLKQAPYAFKQCVLPGDSKRQSDLPEYSWERGKLKFDHHFCNNMFMKEGLPEEVNGALALLVMCPEEGVGEKPNLWMPWMDLKMNNKERSSRKKRRQVVTVFWFE